MEDAWGTDAAEDIECEEPVWCRGCDALIEDPIEEDDRLCSLCRIAVMVERDLRIWEAGEWPVGEPPTVFLELELESRREENGKRVLVGWREDP